MTKELHQAVSQVLIHEWPCGTAFRGLPAKCPLITQVSSWPGPGSVIGRLGSAELSAHAPFHEGQHSSLAGQHLPPRQCPPSKQALGFAPFAGDVTERTTRFLPNPKGLKGHLGFHVPTKLPICLFLPARWLLCHLLPACPQCLLSSECTNGP